MKKIHGWNAPIALANLQCKGFWVFGRDGREKDCVCIYIWDPCSVYCCWAHRAPYLGFIHWHNCLVYYSRSQIDCIATEYRRIEKPSTWTVVSRIAPLCKCCKNKWHCLSVSSFQLPDPAPFKMLSLVILLLSAWYDIAQYHISPKSFLHIYALSENTLKIFWYFVKDIRGAC